jgi:hypothetical protein
VASKRLLEVKARALGEGQEIKPTMKELLEAIAKAVPTKNAVLIERVEFRQPSL